MSEKDSGRRLSFKAGLVGAAVLGVVYLESRMRFTSALAGALVGLPALAEFLPRQSNTDLSQKWVQISCTLLVGGTDEVGRYVPSPGSPGFYANHSTAAVTFDQHSLILDGKRIMVFRYDPRHI